jgi:stearoyl-CoA desaturase (delta-9 desaturase)
MQNLFEKVPASAAEVIHSERMNVPVTAFLLITPILAIISGWAYIHFQGFTGVELGIFIFMYFATGLSITSGYHRYYSHRTYDCPRFVQLLFLLFGGASVENSVLNWASDHRYHHVYSDRVGDPYSVTRSFWWAHIGWMFYHYPANRPYKNSPDLKADKLVVWQDRYYIPIVIVMSFLFPMAIGAAFGHPIGGLIWGGLIRLVVVHHSTFMINSVAHYFGDRPHDEKSTARSSPLLAAFTFGEGYHSFHHAYSGDYRIGHHWYDLDYGKWVILSLHRMGLATKLRKTYKPRRTVEILTNQAGLQEQTVLQELA